MNALITEETLEASDGSELFCRLFSCPEPKGVVTILHGYREHTGLYESFAKELQSQNIAVFSYDLRGHGKSPGERGDIYSIDENVDDLELIVARIQDRWRHVPICLAGHNIGATIAAHYCIQNKKALAGLVLSNIPWQVESTSTQRTIKPFLKLFAPIASDVKLANLPESYGEDSLIHSEALSVLDAIDIEKSNFFIAAKSDHIIVPLLFISSQSNQRRNQDFYENVLSPDKLRIGNSLHLTEPSIRVTLISWLETQMLQATRSYADESGKENEF